MIGMLRPEPEARSVIEPEPGSFRLLLGNLQPLPPPDPGDPLVVHNPACPAQHHRDAAIAVAAILEGQRDDVGGQCRLVI
jgi:hypothetical protein